MIKLRIALLTDENFIKATMLKGLYYGNEFFRQMKQDTFFKVYGEHVGNLLANSTVLVACLAEDPDVILGYAIVDEPALHYIFVKEAWRGKGIATMLVQNLTLDVVTHLTTVGNTVRIKKLLEFNPFYEKEKPV